MVRAMQQHRLALIGAKALAKVNPQVGVTVGGSSRDGDGHGAIVSACHNPNDGWRTISEARPARGGPLPVSGVSPAFTTSDS
jgi:hypothetical protein